MADPPRRGDALPPHLVVIAPAGNITTVAADLLDLVAGEAAPPRACTCPIATLMASGCRCGAIAREREAAAR